MLLRTKFLGPGECGLLPPHTHTTSGKEETLNKWKSFANVTENLASSVMSWAVPPEAVWLTSFLTSQSQWHRHRTRRPPSKARVSGLYSIWPRCCCLVAQACPTVTPWTAAHQASLSFPVSQSLLKLIIPTELVMPSNHLILCHSFPPALDLSQHQGLLQ